MKKSRIFTEKELEEMGKVPRDSAIEAIEAGDKEKAIDIVNGIHNTAQGTLDMFVGWVADLMDYIYVHDGAEGLEEALRKTYERGESKRLEAFSKMDVRGRVEAHAAGLRGLLQKLEIEEDDEKICIKMASCGTGQRLMEAGAYESPRNLSKMSPHRLTWGTKDFPVYCSHAPMQEIIAIEKMGKPMFVRLPAAEVSTESCRLCYYKDDNSIPEEIYHRLGAEKVK
ncbi:hypothetical protein ACFLV2_03680 [Chloroflexota bacterium]